MNVHGIDPPVLVYMTSAVSEAFGFTFCKLMKDSQVIPQIIPLACITGSSIAIKGYLSTCSMIGLLLNLSCEILSIISIFLIISLMAII